MPDERKAEDRVEVPISAHSDFMDVLALPKALLGGTRAMREVGETFLPKEKHEEQADYANRRDRTFLLGAYKRTCQKLTGEVFSKEISLDEDVPSEIKAWCQDDIDLEGSNLTQFATGVFFTGVAKGVAHVLVDYPGVETKVEGGKNGRLMYWEEYEDQPGSGREPEWKPLTKAVQEKKGWRPYWVTIEPEQIIGWRSEVRNGKTVLTQVRIKESTEEPSGEFGTRTVNRIRVLEPGSWTLWVEVKEEGKTTWVVQDRGATSINFIPLATFRIGEKKTVMTATPPLEGLADLNLAHWQSSSDQRNILHFARLVTYFGKCLDIDEKSQKVILGPNQLVHSSEKDADLKVVEHSGKGVDSGRQDLKDLETQMAMFGLTYMMPRTGTATATERAIDSAENSSALRGWASEFAGFLETLLLYTKRYSDPSAESAGSVGVNKEFNNWLKDMHGQVLIDAYEAKLLPREIVIDEFKRRGVISEDVDFQALIQMFQEDRLNFAEPGAGGIAAGFAGAAEEEF